jgi:hypothetical protein
MSLAMISLVHRCDDFHRYSGHSHFWQRAMPRRQFIAKAAGTVGLLLGSGMLGSGVWRAQLARATPPPGPSPTRFPEVSSPWVPGLNSSISSYLGLIANHPLLLISTASSGRACHGQRD